MWLFSFNYNPLLALAQPFYNQLTSPLHMWCILTLLIILKKIHDKILIFVASRAI